MRRKSMKRQTSTQSLSTEDTHKMRTQIIALARGQQFTEAQREYLVRSKLWRKFGYRRFGDYLHIELGFDADALTPLVKRAIEEGVEDELLYTAVPA